MKTIFICALLFAQIIAKAQTNVQINFANNYTDVYHLALIIYTPDGKGQTRVSNVKPNETKSYSYPIGTMFYIANYKQEAYAMKGNDIRFTGIKPFLILDGKEKTKTIFLNTIENKNTELPL